MTSVKIKIRRKGGPGSGNWGHSGRPGQVGGSAPGTGGKIFKKEAYLAKKREWMRSNSPRKQLEAMIIKAKPSYSKEDAEMMADIMLLGRDRFDNYADKIGLKVPQDFKDQVFTGDKAIDRAIAKLKYELEDEACFVMPDGNRFNVMTGPKDFEHMVYGDRDTSKPIPNVQSKLANEFGVTVLYGENDSKLVVDQDMSRLYDVAKAYPVVGKLLQGTKIRYTDAIPEHPTATASWRANTNTIEVHRGNMRPFGTVWIHELMHKADSLYSDNRITKIFGFGRTASWYANMNFSEDFAETATAYVLGYPMQSWLGAKWSYVANILEQI